MRRNLMPFQGRRLTGFKIVMLLVFTGLVARMYFLQVSQYTEFSTQSQGNSIQSVPLQAPRGVIVDRNGVDLARNDASFNVSITPASLPDTPEATLQVYNQLSALLALGNIDVPATRAIADSAGKKNTLSMDEMVTVGAGIAPYRGVTVATDVPREIAQIILEDIQNMPGVSVDSVPVRQYPSGAYTSQIIGYLGPIGADEAQKLRDTGYNPAYDRVGYAGIEAYLDTELAGQRGLETREVDVAGQTVRVIKRDEPIPGKNVRLTIDLDLQKYVHQALETQINYLNQTCGEVPKAQPCDLTESGVVVVMNPQTGEVLAMVSLPTYDNSRFARSIDAEYYLSIKDQPQFPFLNHAIGSLYPPGSTWKILTGSAVVQADVIAPTTFLNDPGRLIVQNTLAPNDKGTAQTFVCWLRTGHGQVDLIHGIAWSCDVYFYQVGGGNDKVSPTSLKTGGLGIPDLDRYATMFGIGTREGIELPAESAGRLPDPTWKRRVYSQSWSTGDTYNAAFGQGYITVTPLQLVNTAAAIANGGTLYHPTIVEGYTDSAGNLLQPFTPNVERTIVLPNDPGLLASDKSPVVLNMREDMYLQVHDQPDQTVTNDSLACVCEMNSKACTDDYMKNYRATFILHHQPHSISTDYHPNQGDETISYTVYVPPDFDFTTSRICDPLQYGKYSEHANYQPPFIDAQNLQLVRDGMHGAVNDSGGTVYQVVPSKDELGRVQQEGLAGKTGTAEYCDNIAAAQGLCVPGSLPSHAWFVGFAPFDKPEVVAVAFVYRGGEGSYHAYPLVQYAIDCYYKLKLDRSHPGTTPSCKDFVPPVHKSAGLG